MKKTKKILALALAAVMLVCTTVAATVAYLTANTGVVNNTFTVGSVAIDLDEADVDVYGVRTQNPRDKANIYKLIPGHEYVKDPTVHVKSGSESCFLFVKVVNEITSVEAAQSANYNTIAKQMELKGWKPVANQAEYPNVYYFDGKYDMNANPLVSDFIVFEEFEIADNANVSSLVGTDGKVTAVVTIDAYAVQADGFVDAPDAWSKAPLADWKA